MANEYWTEFPVRRGFDTLRPIYDVIAGRGYVAGSYAAFMACPRDTPVLPNDIDIFATTQEHADSVADEITTKLDYWWNSDNETVIELVSGTDKPNIQIVRPNPLWSTWPDDILGDFDLDICRAVLVAPDKVLADYNVGEMYGKILRINNPLRTLKRVSKYMARGVKFDDHELLKIFQAWEQMPTERKDVMLALARQTMAYDDVPPSYYTDDDWFEGE